MKAELQYHMRKDYSAVEIKSLIEAWKESGMFAQIQVEGGRDIHLVLTEDLAALESLEKGKVPKGWNPKNTTTLEEVTFLSPLDIVIARGRAKTLFGFEYIWEVYTPVHERRWGYYVLPILYGDDLVARLDLKLDRTTMKLEIKGFWGEEDAPVKRLFCERVGERLDTFCRFCGSQKAGY